MDSCVVKQNCAFFIFNTANTLLINTMEHSFLRHACDGRISHLKRGISAAATYRSRNRHHLKKVGCRLSFLDIE